MRSLLGQALCVVGAAAMTLLPFAACSSSGATPGTDGGGDGSGGGQGHVDAAADHSASKERHDAGKPKEKDSGHDTKDTAHDAAHDAALDAAIEDAADSSTSSSTTSSSSSSGSSTTSTASETSTTSSSASSSTTATETSSTTSSSSSSTTAGVQNYFMGRWDMSAAAALTGVGAVAEWPGSGVITTFTGADVTVSLTDTCNASGSDPATECDTITIEIDGVPVTSAFVTVGTNPGAVVTASETAPFTLGNGVATTLDVSGLTTGVNHTVGVYKNTDTFYGGSYTFNGFIIAGNGTNPSETYTFAHHIEWIGDDITAGTGDLGQSGACVTQASNSSEFYGYSRIVSEYFNAERHNLSVTGVCVTAGDPTPLISTLYAQVTPSDTAAWDFSSYEPDLVVVNLGSYGDFVYLATDPMGPEPGFQDALEEFIVTVRAAHPNAYILLVSGPGWLGPTPNGVEPEAWVEAALTLYQNDFPTDTAVSAFEVSNTMPTAGFECTDDEPGAVLQGSTADVGLAYFVETYIEGLPALAWTAATWSQGQ